MGAADGNGLLRQHLRLVVLVLLVEEHDDRVGRIDRHGGLEQLLAGVGQVRKRLRQDEPGGDALGAVAHGHVDAHQLFPGERFLRLFEQLPLGVAEFGIDVVLRHRRRPRHRFGNHHEVLVLGDADIRLTRGERAKLLVVRVANQPVLLGRGIEDILGGLLKLGEHFHGVSSNG